MGRNRGRAGRVRRVAKREEEEEEEEEEEDEDEDDGGEDDDDDESRKRRRSLRKTAGKQAQYTYSSEGSESDEDSSEGRERRKAGAGVKKTGKARRELPPGAVAILKQWLLSSEHVNHPYPTAQDQQQLMAQTGIDKKQLKNWFTNARRRIWKPMMRKKREEEGSKGEDGAASTTSANRPQASQPRAHGQTSGGGMSHAPSTSKAHQQHQSGSRNNNRSSGGGQSHNANGADGGYHHTHHAPPAQPPILQANQSSQGGLQKVSSIGSMLSLSGIASVEDFFKSFFNEPMASPGGPNNQQGNMQHGGGSANGTGAGGGMSIPQPGMHPLVNAFKSSRSLSNLRAASVAEFPRTDSYAFLEVFFNDEGLECLGTEPMETIGLSMDGDGPSCEGSPRPTMDRAEHPMSLKRHAEAVVGAMDGVPNGKRLAPHVAYAVHHHQQQLQQQQHGGHQQQSQHHHHQQSQQLPDGQCSHAYSGNNNGALMRQSQQLGSMLQQSPMQPPMAPPSDPMQVPQAYFPPFKTSSSMTSGPYGHLGPLDGTSDQQGVMMQHPHHQQQQVFVQGGQQHHAQHMPRGAPTLPQAVHVSTAARCPFCPELNVDTQLRPCGHLFHGNCLKPWLEEAQGPPGCPVCSVTITSCVLAIPCINTAPGPGGQGGRRGATAHHGMEDAGMYHMGRG